MVGSAHAADSVAGQFAEWSGDSTVSRQMTLRELGFRQPLVLSGQESQREVYLPVPAGVATRDAQLQLDGRYVRGHAGRTSGLWSVDGDPIAARSITDAQGDASQLLAIDGEPRQNGFVRVGVGWWSIVSDYQCADQSAPANVLRLSPDSRFSYRFDGRAVDTVAKAWGALPRRCACWWMARHCRRPPTMRPGASVPQCRPVASRCRWWRCPRLVTVST